MKDDTISRKAAIKAIKEDKIDLTNPNVVAVFKATGDFEKVETQVMTCDRHIEILKDLPSAQLEQQWIPCNERLPEEDTEVLISYRYKEGEGDTDHVNIDITSYGTICFGGREIHTLKEWRQPFDYFHANYEVIAWMPLPEPYKEDEQG